MTEWASCLSIMPSVSCLTARTARQFMIDCIAFAEQYAQQRMHAGRVSMTMSAGTSRMML